MKYLKILALAVLAVAAQSPLIGSAYATTLTAPAGTLYNGSIKATLSGPLQTDEPIVNNTLSFTNTECQESTFAGNASVPNNATIPLSSVKLDNCNASLGYVTVSVLKPGTLQVHTDTASANGNGIVTWSGAEITVLTHRKDPFWGTPFTEHCIYYTENTPFGTLTGSNNRENKTALLNVAFKFLNKATDSVCAEPMWTGSYTIEAPFILNVD